MRTPDRIVMLTVGLLMGATQAFAFDGAAPPPANAPAQAAPVAPVPAIMRPVQVQPSSEIPPRPPGLIPQAAGIAPAAAIPNAALPRPRAPVPVLSVTPPAIDRPLPPPTAFAAPSVPITPFEAFKSGARALRDGKKEKAVKELEYAADRGVVAAQWKLARMYAEGDSVDQSDAKAFEYFSRIANGHPDDSPNGPQARYVANAFVSLGHYYREGIPDSEVKADISRARQLYSYAASYFGDPDAQYYLARMLLDGAASNNDPRQATRWLNSAANKGQYQAQAVLGRILFKGEHVPRQGALGLMWLALANANAAPSEAWIGELYESALKQATNDERALAGEFLVRWMNGKRN